MTIDTKELRRLAQAAENERDALRAAMRRPHQSEKREMTKGDIIRMAREAGDDVDHTLPSDLDFLERFAALVAAAEREAAEKECDNAIDTQRMAILAAELNGAERERDALRAENSALVEDMNLLRDNNTALRAKIAEMEQQEPVAKVRVHQTGGNAGIAWSVAPLNDFDALPLMRDGSKLYALPGAQPATSVPEDVMRDAERYRYLRARDDGTAGVGCWIEADGRVCDRGWLYGVQLDSAIDSFIEVLAAAQEAKP